MNSLAERLVASRTHRDWSQDELADKVGCSQSFIGALETGRQKTSKWLPEIAHTLGVDLYWMKTGIETIIAGDKQINDVVKLMRSMNNIGRAIVLDKAKEMAKEYPNNANGKQAA